MRRGAGCGASGLAGARFAALAHRLASVSSTGAVCDQPRQASVIDTPGAAAGRGEILAAFLEMAFDHHAGDARVAAGQLRGHVLRDLDLAQVRLVGMACEKSIMTCSRWPALRSTAQQASTLAAS